MSHAHLFQRFEAPGIFGYPGQAANVGGITCLQHAHASNQRKSLKELTCCYVLQHHQFVCSAGVQLVITIDSC